MFNFVAKLAAKILNKRSRKKSKIASKKTLSPAASFELTSETEKTKAKLENGVKIILKKFGSNPEMLLTFVEKNGTEVFKLASANKFLRLIGYEEGFVIPTRGFKSFYINTVIAAFAGQKIKLSVETEPKFILSKNTLEQYFIIQQFYKWYGKKLNLAGFEPEAQDVLQKYLNYGENNVSELSVQEILELKEAIARDVESIDFIVDMAKNTEGSKNALKKMTDGGASV